MQLTIDARRWPAADGTNLFRFYVLFACCPPEGVTQSHRIALCSHSIIHQMIAPDACVQHFRVFRMLYAELLERKHS